MNSVTLKAKITHNYRKARKGDPTCAGCLYLHDKEIFGLDGKPRGFRDFRCAKFGLENSRRYAVSPKTSLCDLFAAPNLNLTCDEK